MTPSQRSIEWIEKTMELAGLSQTKLAARLGIKRTSVTRALNHTKDMNVSTLFRYIEACGYEITELRVRKKER